MKTNGLFLLLVSFVLFFGACSSVKITSDYDKTADFSQYKTLQYYGWAENSDQILSAFDKQRIEQAFADEFRKRGYTLVEDNGDIVVALFIVVNTETATTAYTDYYGGGWGGYGWGGYGWGWGAGYATTSYNTYDYKVGTLVCDVFDAKEKKPIWQGVASGAVDENPKSREKRIPKVVAGIMAKYPVKPVK